MKKAEKIKVGDKVRSFDFNYRDIEGPNACYVEGVVESIEGHPMGGGGKFLKFAITRKVFGGEETNRSVGEHNWVPQNGQQTLMGLTNNVVKI